tara:strand:- start:1022 stop:2467 length:1446 start_codon:yes stop_codon:yes gene_type:complete
MKKLIYIGVLLSLSFPSVGSMFIPNNATYYYRIEPAGTYIPPVRNGKILSIGGNVSGQSVLACGNFNPMVSMKNGFRNIKETMMGSLGPIVENIQGSIMAIGMYKIQQMNPGLYDTITNASFDLNNKFDMNVSNCSQKLKGLQNGGGLFEDVVQVSDSQGWLDLAKQDKDDNGGSVDIINSSKELEKNRGKWGIPWVHRKAGNSGGSNENQAPIKLTSDVVIAGYNIMLDNDRALDSDVAATIEEQNNKGLNIARYWKKPSDAGKWATYVLGETQISAKETIESKSSTAGLGLSAVLHSCPHLTENGDTCIENVRAALWDLVDGIVEITDDSLRNVSPENMAITDKVITTIRFLDKENQLVLVESLAEKIATQNLLNQALMLRRIFQAGLQVQEVQNLKELRGNILTTISNLEYEIKSIAFEHDVREKMMSKTVQTILDINAELKAESTTSGEEQSPIIKDGAIYKDSDDTRVSKKQKGSF